jgi:hypothetical protein
MRCGVSARNEDLMLRKIMKWGSIAILLLAALRPPSAGYQVFLEFIVCVSGLQVITQAVRGGKYVWAAGFTGIVVLFNPLVPVALSRQTFLWVDLVCLGAFLASLVVLKREPDTLNPVDISSGLQDRIIVKS